MLPRKLAAPQAFKKSILRKSICVDECSPSAQFFGQNLPRVALGDLWRAAQIFLLLLFPVLVWAPRFKLLSFLCYHSPLEWPFWAGLRWGVLGGCVGGREVPLRSPAAQAGG